MHIPTHSTLLVPANLHLAMYQTILSQHSNCLDIEVVTLQAYIQRFLPMFPQENVERIYQYRDALKELPDTNAFYASRFDPAFLHACFDLLKLTKTYGIHTFPNETAKQQDLQAILDCLDTIPLKEDAIPSIEIDASSVYILKQEYPVHQQFWIEYLLAHGAQWLASESVPQKEYFSCANARKQAQFVAEHILERGYIASDIMIALADPKDTAVVTQMLAQHHIPYTYLHPTSEHKIVDQWICALEWIIEPSLDTFQALIHTLFSQDAAMFDEYLHLFPEAFPRFEQALTDAYEENVFIDQKDYKHLQALEQKIQAWIKEHDIQWTARDLDTIAQCIQSQNAPTKQNIRLFGNIETLCQASLPYIEHPEDLRILCHDIAQISQSYTPESIQGVLIGHRSDITALRPITYFIGAHAKAFPNLRQENGVFNEAYWANTKLPRLASRLDFQRELLFSALSQPEHIIVVIPEFDYAQKSFEASVEMDAWMDKKPTFVHVEESSTYIEPQFTLSEHQAKQLFFKDNTYYGSISRLETFASCPLKHFLRYGIGLQEPKEWTDLKVRGSLLHHVLECITSDHQKDYASISKEEITHYVQQEFAWVQTHFPSRNYWLQTQKQEVIQALVLVLKQLQAFEDAWHMSIGHQEYRVTKEFQWNDYTIHFTGYVDRIDTTKQSFTVFDYKSGKRELTLESFQSGLSLQLPTYTILFEEETGLLPIGHFYITLSTSPLVLEGAKINYRGKKNNWNAMEVDALKEQFMHGQRPNGWAYQDVSTYADSKTTLSIKRGTPSFETIKEQWDTIVDSLFEDMSQGDIAPNHHTQACTYCDYRWICRNARQEVVKKNRIEEGEE